MMFDEEQNENDGRDYADRDDLPVKYAFAPSCTAPEI